MKIIKADEIIDSMIEFWRKGAEPPLNLGMGSLNEYYGLKLGTVTDITGYPYSGKTLFLKEILINTYLKHKIKHCLYLPDDGDIKEIIENIIHKLTGKTFNKKFTNLITENEVYKWTRLILNDFVVVDDDQDLTPEELWLKSIEMECKTCSIDSWNNMTTAENTPTFLKKTLRSRNRIARANKVSFFTIIHPKNPTSQNYDKDGNLKPPNQFDLMGGSEWNNNAQNIISVHKEEREGINYDIYVRKTKPRIVGKTGFTTMQFDIPSQRFYNINQGDHSKGFFYDSGFKEEKKEQLKDLEELNINLNFDNDEAPF